MKQLPVLDVQSGCNMQSYLAIIKGHLVEEDERAAEGGLEGETSKGGVEKIKNEKT
jgi:hypothetical protein